jgi:hypothetical protein
VLHPDYSIILLVRQNNRADNMGAKARLRPLLTRWLGRAS